jgi:hypothetical protein
MLNPLCLSEIRYNRILKIGVRSILLALISEAFHTVTETVTQFHGLSKFNVSRPQKYKLPGINNHKRSLGKGRKFSGIPASIFRKSLSILFPFKLSPKALFQAHSRHSNRHITLFSN